MTTPYNPFMYRPNRFYGRHGWIATFLVALLLPLAVGCSQSRIPLYQEEQITEGANRIIVTRQNLGDEIGAPKLASTLYLDTQRQLERRGFDIAEADPDALTILTEPKQVAPNLVVQIDANVQQISDGSELIAAVDWAPSVPMSPAGWNDAAWTSGSSQIAFTHGYDVLQGISRTSLGVATE